MICNHIMRPGIAIGQTSGNTNRASLSQWAGGRGYLMRCMKCILCGHSVTG